MTDQNNLNPGQKLLLSIMEEKREQNQALTSNVDPQTQEMLNKPTPIQTGDDKVDPKTANFSTS